MGGGAVLGDVDSRPHPVGLPPPVTFMASDQWAQLRNPVGGLPDGRTGDHCGVNVCGGGAGRDLYLRAGWLGDSVKGGLTGLVRHLPTCPHSSRAAINCSISNVSKNSV